MSTEAQHSQERHTASNAPKEGRSTKAQPERPGRFELPELTLVAPVNSAKSVPQFSLDQQAVIDLGPGSGPVLLWGAPGTGKSTVLIEAALKRMEHDGVDPAGALLLAPSRLAAARLRDGFSARLTKSLSTSPARTWSSYAFDLLRRAKVEGRMPHLESAPRLMSGPEQDLIIRDLLAGHAMGLGTVPAWPKELTQALETRGFRQEIRQLFDRVIEYGLVPEELAELGAANRRPDWVAAASLYKEYRDVVDWGKSGSFDPAGIITAATTLLRLDSDFLDQERKRLALIVVDDIQEANKAVHELLHLVGQGKDVLVAASPDTVVQGFRGARPDLVASLTHSLSTPEHPLQQFALSTSHRMSKPLAAAWSGVADRIFQIRGGHKARELAWPEALAGRHGGHAAAPHAEAINATEPAGGEPGPVPRQELRKDPDKVSYVSAHFVASEVHELRLVAERILHLQHLGGHSLSEIAVIVRTGSALAALQRYLSAQGIAVKVPVAENPVRDEPAVRPLLEAFGIALAPETLDAEACVALLTSRLGRSTALHLRRLRQALRQQERHAGGGRASDELLVEALLNSQKLAPLGWEAANAARIAAMIAAGREAVAQPGANAETVLWALWEACDSSGTWEAQALRGGPTGIRADRDLDAVMALFQTAERYVDQLPGSSPQQFLDYLMSQELPMDTLAARAQRTDAVEIVTPASAAGREWPIVIVAGLQEGVWPNTRLRGELLGSQLLVDVLEKGAQAAHQIEPAARLRDIRYDELRSFAAAISRASHILILTAAAGHDLQPSQFIDLAAPYVPVTDSGGESQYPVRPVEQVPRPMTLRSLVAELRQESEMRTNPEAARMLAVLAGEDVPGADPHQWWGLLPLSSDGPIVAPGEPVNVSPSKVEEVLKSPLNWFIRAAGGDATTDFARSLGTLIHSIAQDIPNGAGHEYLAELDKRWPSLGLPESWESDLDYKRAQEMLGKLAQYVIEARQQGRTLLGVEENFSVDVGELPDGILPSTFLPGTFSSSTGVPSSAVPDTAVPDTKDASLSSADGGAPEAEDTDTSGLAEPPPARVVRLRGQVDRLEADANGNLIIVDIKTGRTKPTKDQVLEHPQLGAYQVAASAGAFSAQAEAAGLFGASSGGAALLPLGDGTKNVKTQDQPAMVAGSENDPTRKVMEAALLMAQAVFPARHGADWSERNGCPLPTICPLCPEGKQITE
ncbi:ATP-dependent helicase [Arthrobacter antibioticus]|uniref:ATP-dependent helicase n=1 Tax=Arthrobacter sp. H35-MC1 TaxID=3046203 RepID=UPI0024B99996|nr:ATP-dependent DNA helicase [Arthrobacter sp. H35-MC1]MDJ0317519.1 ATP-dependent DNA helicase [Arthrobacter sp. H35-MC1]